MHVHTFSDISHFASGSSLRLNAVSGVLGPSSPHAVFKRQGGRPASGAPLHPGTTFGGPSTSVGSAGPARAVDAPTSRCEAGAVVVITCGAPCASSNAYSASDCFRIASASCWIPRSMSSCPSPHATIQGCGVGPYGSRLVLLHVRHDVQTELPTLLRVEHPVVGVSSQRAAIATALGLAVVHAECTPLLPSGACLEDRPSLSLTALWRFLETYLKPLPLPQASGGAAKRLLYNF